MTTLLSESCATFKVLYTFFVCFRLFNRVAPSSVFAKYSLPTCQLVQGKFELIIYIYLPTKLITASLKLVSKVQE